MGTWIYVENTIWANISFIVELSFNVGIFYETFPLGANFQAMGGGGGADFIVHRFWHESRNWTPSSGHLPADTDNFNMKFKCN